MPKNSALRKLNDLIKRARSAKVHAYIISELKEEIEESKKNITKYTEQKRTKVANEEKAKLARLEYQIEILNAIKEAKENITKYEENKRVKRASDEKATLERLERQLEILNEIEEAVTYLKKN